MRLSSASWYGLSNLDCRMRRFKASPISICCNRRLAAASMRSPLILLLLLALIGCRHPSERTHAPVIGLVTGLSGPTAAWGEAIRRGAELAIDEARARGQQIELAVEDDQGRPEQSANVAAGLVGRGGVVALVGADTSGGTLAIAPLAESHRIAIVSPTGSAPRGTRRR